MTDIPSTSGGPEPAHSAIRVLAAIADLTEATAAAIAEHAGLGYSTVTPKLRAWETSGHAEKYRHAGTNQTLWRLTAAGRAATAATGKTAQPIADSPEIPPATPTEIGTTESPVDDVRHDGDTAEGSTEHVTEPAAGQPRTGTPAQTTTETAAAPPTTDTNPLPADPIGDGDGAGDEGSSAPEEGKGQPAFVAKRKRPAGALEASVLAILRARPGDTFKVNDLRKLVDAADQGTGYPAASAGAIANALTKLAGKGQVDTVQEKPATFQATPVRD